MRERNDFVNSRCAKAVLAALCLLAVIVTVTVLPAVTLTWSDLEVRLTTDNNFDGFPAITQTSDGRIWIFWTKNIRGNPSIVYQVSATSGTITWSPETVLVTEAGTDTSPSVFQMMNGTIWVVWSSSRSGDYDLYYKTSADGGVTWSNETRLTTDPTRDLSPAATQTTDGTIWVVWSSARSGGYDLYYKTSADGGVTWSNETGLTTGPELDKVPSITQTSDGTVWLAYCSDRLGDYEIYYKTHDGLSWSNETQLTIDPKVDMHPEILETVDGSISVFWSSRVALDLPSSTDDLYYTSSSDHGATWSDRIQFTTDEYDDTWPAVAQTRDTKIWVVWTSDRADQPDYGNWDIYYRTSLVGDVNSDGVVDIYDLSIVGKAYGAVVGQPAYNPEADINKDGRVDIRDIALVGRNYSST